MVSSYGHVWFCTPQKVPIYWTCQNVRFPLFFFGHKDTAHQAQHEVHETRPNCLHVFGMQAVQLGAPAAAAQHPLASNCSSTPGRPRPNRAFAAFASEPPRRQTAAASSSRSDAADLAPLAHTSGSRRGVSCSASLVRRDPGSEDSCSTHAS